MNGPIKSSLSLAAQNPAAEEAQAPPVNSSHPLTPWWVKAANAAAGGNATSQQVPEKSEKTEVGKTETGKDALQTTGGAATETETKTPSSKPSPHQEAAEAQAP